MNVSLDIVLDDSFSQLSLKVSQHPKSLVRWEELLNYLIGKVTPLNKAIDKQLANLIRSTYESMLSHFPFLENYYVDYALFEYKLGDIKSMHKIFQMGLQKFNNMSLLLWTEYLKMCNHVVMSNKQLFKKYELAESFIGLHFFSGQFWEMYLEQVEMRCKTPNRYLIILRKVLEIPHYSYSNFFAKWLQCIEDIRDLKQVALFAPQEELWKRLKIDIFLGSRRGPHLEDAKKQLKKFTKELYMTIQYQVLEVYNLFEIHLKTHYYCSPESLIDQNQVLAWCKYLDYTETNRISQQVRLNYQRALIPLAHYDTIWLKYANWLIDKEDDFLTSKNVLLQGLQMSHKKAKLLDRLSSVLIKLGDYSTLTQLYTQVEDSYSDGIQDTDDCELFLDYLQYKIFLTRNISQSRYNGGDDKDSLLLDHEILDIIMKRLSYGKGKSGQELLLSMLKEMYSRIPRIQLENRIFKPIIEQNWDYYLNNGKFWYEYCHCVWYDPKRSYLEKRKYVVRDIWTQASKYQSTVKDSLKEFCDSYLPEDLDTFESTFN